MKRLVTGINAIGVGNQFLVYAADPATLVKALGECADVAFACGHKMP
jgi:hypothetical protein